MFRWNKDRVMMRFAQQTMRMLLCVIVTAAAQAADQPANPPVAKTDAPAPLAPGSETRVELPKAGTFFLLYVPLDYTPDRAFPVIFCYHGYHGQATTHPFRKWTDGRGFIVIGMNYATTEYGDHPMHEFASPEIACFKETLELAAQRLNVNRNMLFMGGISQGGYSTVCIGETLIDRLAGLIVLCAGRAGPEYHPPDPDFTRNKPIFIGAGDQDKDHFPWAKLASKSYRDWGADVTFDVWPGLGHTVPPQCPAALEFLYKAGPLRDYPGLIAQAEAAQKAKQVGKAMAFYQQAAALLPDHSRTQGARDAAKVITDQAEARFAAVQQAIDGKLFPEALRMLGEMSGDYSGSAVADRAKQWIDKFTTDPRMREQIAAARLNRKAGELRAGAEKAESAGDFAAALKIYQTYLAQCAGADDYDAVKAHYEQLKSDPKVLAVAHDQTAAGDCKEWLAMARNLITAGRKAQAKPYLQKVIDKYPDTDYAAEAKKMLAEM
ncbi:MAG: hypothetical protein ACYC26_08295 [Phycisphaerales bacterium]